MVRKQFILIGLLICVLATSAKAQFSTEKMVEKWKNYQEQSGRQILNLSVNQPAYHISDTLFFKAYLTEESRILATGKHIATAALYSSTGLVSQIKYEIRDGVGVNQLVFPNDITPGIYKLVSYTNWMKNFDPEFLFEKEIKVVNQHEVAYEVSGIQSYAISGGKFIDGLSTVLVARSLISDANIELIKNNVPVDAKVTDSNGMTQFDFVPEQGSAYQLRINKNEQVIELPAVMSKGSQLVIKSNDVDQVEISSVSKGVSGKASLITVGNGELVDSREVTLSAKQDYRISLIDKPLGIIEAYLLSPTGDVLSFVSTYHESRGQSTTVKPLAAAKTRDQVKLSFEPLHQEGVSKLHAKVLNKSVFSQQSKNQFQDEIRYFADAPYDITLDRSDAIWQNQLQQFLTLTARPLNWSEILFRDIFTKVHAKDNLIRRMAIATDSLGKPLERGSRIMMYFHQEYIRLEGLTGANGKIRLHFPGIEARSEMFYSAMDRKGKPLKGAQLNWLPEIEPDIQLPESSYELEEMSEYGVYASKKYEISSSYDFFQKSADTTDRKILNNFMDLFEENVIASDDVFKTADYELFPTMKQYINEVISPIQVYNSFGRQVARIKSLRANNEIGDEPLFIIDGIGTKDLDYFLSLNPKNIEEIRIIREPDKLSLFSTMGQNGIVMIKSKAGDHRPPKNENNIIEGLNPSLSKTSISTTSNDIPIFDANVYWEPIWLNVAKALIFTQTDDLGTMSILVEGFQNELPVSYVFEYEAVTEQGSN